tara:strand:+ start:3655 stop:4980 length:1326 start_codon:yes stop_codon:yes gene_type:complete
MSGVALALLKKGFSISGSDPIKNDRITELKKNGALVFDNQSAKNINLITKKFADKKIHIIISSAIKNDNEELTFCIKKNLNIKHRSEILSSIMKSYKSIAVTGTHGKTSTSTFLTTLLSICTKNTSSIIGGIMPYYSSNTFLKDTKYLVTEIDESDGTTCNYAPYLGIINNIDFDHCDFYSDMKDLISSFKKFGSNSEQLLTNYDCKITQKNINSNYKWSIKEKKGINFSMIPKEVNQGHTIADYYENEKLIRTIKIPVPGLHNLSNVTAAISACRILNIKKENIIENINYLQLPKKRFELRGEIYDRKIIDDYAHHPNEIKATIDLARLFINTNKQRLVVIFQPHRYSRVSKFISEFVNELSKADLIIITDIYSAGETNSQNINSQTIVNKIYNLNKNVMFINNNYEIAKNFLNITNKGDLILNMGAGNCHNLWSLLQSK